MTTNKLRLINFLPEVVKRDEDAESEVLRFRLNPLNMVNMESKDF